MKSRGLSIFLYILSFFLLFFITGIVIIHSYYFIPFDTNGLQTDRSYPVGYLLMFGFISILFGSFMTYTFLSVFGKYNYKEVFAYGRKKVLFLSSFFTFALVYFITELLVGYIVLNYGDPNSFINGSTNSIVVNTDKSFTNINYSNSINNTNMFTIKDKHIVSFIDSNVIHYGNGRYREIGLNSIINALEGATINGNRLMLTVKGNYTEGIFVKNSSLKLENSNILVEGNYSVGLFGDNSNIFIDATSISGNSNYLCVFRNGTDITLDSTNLIYSDNINHVFYISSDSYDSINKVTLKGTTINDPRGDLFKIEESKTILNFEDVSIDWKDTEKSLIDFRDSNVEINIINSKVSGKITVSGNSTLKINMINSEFYGSVEGIDFELTMDEDCTFNSDGDIKLKLFNGTDEAFNNVNSLNNHVYIGTEIKK